MKKIIKLYGTKTGKINQNKYNNDETNLIEDSTANLK